MAIYVSYIIVYKNRVKAHAYKKTHSLIQINPNTAKLTYI